MFRYQVLDGVPVLLPEPEEVVVKPLDHRSNEVPQALVEWLASFPGWTLNLGAGATEFVLPQSVELEHAVFRNTDVVGDAHHLPFADAVFDAVLCLNTFEHLREPHLAARELYRVMRPGSHLFLHTAFLQPLHEEPYHFYDTTEPGLLQWFRDFAIERCSVPPNMSPAMVLGWLATELIHHSGMQAGKRAAELMKRSTLADWQRIWTDPTERSGSLWNLLEGLPEDVRKRFSAGFQLEAVKPS